MTEKRSIVLLGIACVLVMGISPAVGQVVAEPDVPALLTHIVLTKPADGLDIKLLCTFYSSFQAVELSAPNRIVVDLNGVEDIAAPRLVEVGQSGILRIRAGMFLEGTARVVLDLAGELPFYRVALIKGGLLLSIRPRPGTAQAVEPKPKAQTDLKARSEAPAKAGRKENQFSIIGWILRLSFVPVI